MLDFDDMAKLEYLTSLFFTLITRQISNIIKKLTPRPRLLVAPCSPPSSLLTVTLLADAPSYYCHPLSRCEPCQCRPLAAAVTPLVAIFPVAALVDFQTFLFTNMTIQRDRFFLLVHLLFLLLLFSRLFILLTCLYS